MNLEQYYMNIELKKRLTLYFESNNYHLSSIFVKDIFQILEDVLGEVKETCENCGETIIITKTASLCMDCHVKKEESIWRIILLEKCRLRICKRQIHI